MTIRKIKKNPKNIKDETAHTLTILCFSYSRLGRIVNPPSSQLLCVSSMITSVIVPLGHRNIEGEREK
jgi:hypothetical protein